MRSNCSWSSADMMLNDFSLKGILVLALMTGCASTPSVYEPELGRDTIRAVVSSHFRAVQACYEAAIDERPGAMGKVVANWDILPTGKVTNVILTQVDSSLEGIRPCLIAQLSSWKFPASTAQDVTAVTYPYFFDERAHGRTNDDAVKRSLEQRSSLESAKSATTPK